MSSNPYQQILDKNRGMGPGMDFDAFNRAAAARRLPGQGMMQLSERERQAMISPQMPQQPFNDGSVMGYAANMLSRAGALGGMGPQQGPGSALDPRAISGNPQGFQEYMQAMQQREQQMPGSTMLSQQQPQQVQQPAFMQDPEFQGYQTQAQALQQQMNDYMKQAPMYQQMQDLQGKMQTYQQKQMQVPGPQQPMGAMSMDMPQFQTRTFGMPQERTFGQFQQPQSSMMGLYAQPQQQPGQMGPYAPNDPRTMGTLGGPSAPMSMDMPQPYQTNTGGFPPGMFPSAPQQQPMGQFQQNNAQQMSNFQNQNQNQGNQNQNQNQNQGGMFGRGFGGGGGGGNSGGGGGGLF
jgi:uncharacterized membrane protein YgcG